MDLMFDRSNLRLESSHLCSCISGFSGPAHAAGAQVVQIDRSYVTGTGRVGATNLSGNADLVRGSDGTHPSRWGMKHHARYVGGKLAAAWTA
jgi:hypothetical protein